MSESTDLKAIGDKPRRKTQAEYGALGPQERERRWLEGVGKVRQQLLVDAPDAATNLGEIVRGNRAPNTVGASTAILDRIGLGPNASLDVKLGGSASLAAIIMRLDKGEEPND